MSSQDFSDRILVIEFGGQYTHLINRRIRDFGVFSELISNDNSDEINTEDIKGIILSGGPRSVTEVNSPTLSKPLINLILKGELPILGICYGHQLLGSLFNGRVKTSERREYGNTTISTLERSKILPDVKEFDVWMSHGDHVESVSEEFVITAKSDTCPVVSMEHKSKNVFGVQFHPEVTHTKFGNEILRKFVVDICSASTASWTMEAYRDELIMQLTKEIESKKVLLAVSGGVDSSVAALILNKAIGDNLHTVFVDHGLLRKNEAKNVIKTFTEELGFKNFHFEDASDIFLSKLEGVTDPEEKRKIIGHTFIEVFENTANKLYKETGGFHYLAQGTIYSDRVESGAAGSGTAKIKSHHNLTLPDGMTLEILEPLKELYKDEVRELGKTVDLPPLILNRYPFPGPGLGVRILGEVTRERVRILQEADHIFLEEIYANNIQESIWQAFAALLPINAVGVQGDNRSYGNIIALRAVDSKDGMTADFVDIPHNIIGKVATRIINHLPEITRVVYDVSTKPPGTIEFE
jgi:GMP synthase (glutamine-hydrolysing)